MKNLVMKKQGLEKAVDKKLRSEENE